MFFTKFAEEDFVNEFEKNLEKLNNQDSEMQIQKLEGAIELINSAANLLSKVSLKKEANTSQQIVKKILLEAFPSNKKVSQFFRKAEDKFLDEVVIDDEVFPLNQSKVFELGKEIGFEDLKNQENPDILYHALMHDIDSDSLLEFAKGYAFGAKLDDNTAQKEFKKLFQFLESEKDSNLLSIENNCSYCNDAASVEDTGFCSKDCEDAAFLDDLSKFVNNDTDMHDAQCIGTKSSPVGSPRQRSFCKRMCGHKKKNTNSETAKDPDSCINQALRRWKCRCQ